jgi:hypothetical protein
MPAAIFSFTVGFFPFGSLAVSPLGFTVILAFSGDTAFVTTIGLSPPATPTNREKHAAATTANLD